MKHVRFFRWVALTAMAGFLASCDSLPPQAANPKTRFHDAAEVNLVIRFYNWDSMQVTWPDTRSGGYLPLFNRHSIERELRRPDLGRNLAVVVVGYMHSDDQEVEWFRDWKSMLVERGFRRVVFLRGTGKCNIDGLPVLRDSAIAGGT